MALKTPSTEHIFSYSLSASFIALICIYLYCFSMTIFTISSQNDLLKKSDALSTEIATLQSDYLFKTRALGASSIEGSGLVRLTDTRYVNTTQALGLHVAP